MSVIAEASLWKRGEAFSFYTKKGIPNAEDAL
jgi:hypothetical protein